MPAEFPDACSRRTGMEILVRLNQLLCFTGFVLRACRTDCFATAIEDYVKAIYALHESTGEPVTTSALAAWLGVTPASASAMIKRLAEHELVSHVPYHGVSLTREGLGAALKVVRRHRLLETFLARELGMSWERVHDEAEVLEHVLSDDLEALIAAKLGDPRRDPHGAPIPSADLELPAEDTVALASLPVGARGTFVEVSDTDPEMLRYLAARSIAPGDEFEVVEREPFGGPLLIRIGAAVHSLGGVVAEAMRAGPTSARTTFLPVTNNGDDR